MLSSIKDVIGKVLRSGASAPPKAVTMFDLYQAFDEDDDSEPVPDDLILLKNSAAARGLPVKMSTQRLLEPHRHLLKMIRQTMSLSPEEYRDLIVPVIGRFARHVHLLPASENHHHRRTGGLLHHSLEVAFHAVRGCHFHVFTEATLKSKRKEIDRRYQVGAFLAGLFHDIGKTWTDMVVADESGEHIWLPYSETISMWSKRVGSDRYYVKWVPGRLNAHQQQAVGFIGPLVHNEFRQWIGEYGPTVMARVQTTLNYTELDHPFAQMIMEADSISVSQDLAGRKVHESALEAGWGASVPVTFLDTLCHLVSSGKWTVNQRGSRIWVLNEGVFVVWNPAVEEVREILRNDGVKPLPRAAEYFADQFIEEKLAEPFNSGDGGESYWTISPDILMNPEGKRIRLKCVKLSTPGALFRNIPLPEAVRGEIGPEGKIVTSVPPHLMTSADITQPEVGSVAESGVAPMFNLDVISAAAPKPFSPTKGSSVASNDTAKKVGIELTPVSIDDIIAGIDTAPPRKATVAARPSIPTELAPDGPLFELDVDDSLFGGIPPLKVDVAPKSENEIPNAEPTLALQINAAPVVKAIKSQPQATKQKPAPSIVDSQAIPEGKSALVAFFNGDDVLVSALLKAAEAKTLLDGRGGRVFLSALDSQFTDADEARFKSGGWLWKDPTRPGQVKCVLNGKLGHIFDSDASSAIVAAFGKDVVNRSIAQIDSKAKQDQHTKKQRDQIPGQPKGKTDAQPSPHKAPPAPQEIPAQSEAFQFDLSITIPRGNSADSKSDSRDEQVSVEKSSATLVEKLPKANKPKKANTQKPSTKISPAEKLALPATEIAINADVEPLTCEAYSGKSKAERVQRVVLALVNKCSKKSVRDSEFGYVTMKMICEESEKLGLQQASVISALRDTESFCGTNYKQGIRFFVPKGFVETAEEDYE